MILPLVAPAGIMPAVGWRGSLAVVAIAGAVIFVGIRLLGGGGGRSGIATFYACIRETRFLVLVHEPRGGFVLEKITDRARGDLVGEVAVNRAFPVASRPMLGGAAAATDRYLMSTATPDGRDASAIERCWDSFSPPA
jgi:hypothetical protein